jgi:hypothetical protein
VRVTPACDTINSIVVNDVYSIQRDPDIVFGAGVHFVVWGDARGGDSYIFGARVSPAGTVLDPSGIGISLEPGEAPVVEFDGSRFFVVWTTVSDIKGMFCSTGGAPQDSVTITSGGTAIYAPNIAFDGTNYLVTWIEWTGSSYEIRGQMVSQTGTLIGPQLVVGPTSVAIKPGMCFDGNLYCISWTQANDIFARQYTTSGAPNGPAFTVSHTPDMQIFSDVAAGMNKYLFTWGQLVSSDYDVHGNVDITIGVEEANTDAYYHECMPTIIQGPLPLPVNGEYRVFAVTGREISTSSPGPGIYFIKTGNTITTKIIKVR